jgi:hypothetical protein
VLEDGQLVIEVEPPSSEQQQLQQKQHQAKQVEEKQSEEVPAPPEPEVPEVQEEVQEAEDEEQHQEEGIFETSGAEGGESVQEIMATEFIKTEAPEGKTKITSLCIL